MQGWIKLHRKIAENPIWLSEPFTDGQALVDLIILANHKEGLLKVRGIRLQIKRGQVGWSELKLAERWQWSRGKVRRFLKHLEGEKVIKIEQQKNKVTSLITIINYKLYQSSGTTNDTTDGQQTGQQTDTNKNDKEEQRMIQEFSESKNLNGSFEKVVNLWLKYKKEKKQSYKPVGLQTLLKKLYDYSHGDSKKAMDIVEHSISNNYSGIFELKQKQKSKVLKCDEINYDDEPKRNY